MKAQILPYVEVLPGDTFLVTGKDRSGKRFRRVFSSWRQALAINLWQGNVWLVRNGKRKLIQSTLN